MQITKRRLAKQTEFETPYYIIEGISKGQTVMVTAGVHGNERASVLAAKKLLDHLRNGIMHLNNGTLIVIPIVNRYAYEQRIRGVPDLNRTFPKQPHTAARHPLSASIVRLAKRFQPAWYIDLHEANGLSKQNPRVLGQTLITNPKNNAVPSVKRIVDSINRTIAQKSRHFTLRLHHLPGSGRTAATRLLLARAVTVETSYSLPIADRVHYQLELLGYLLNEAGMLKDDGSTSST